MLLFFYKNTAFCNKQYLPVLLLLFVFITGFQCKDYSNKLLGPGIILTIDKPPDTWYQVKDFMKENNVKLTFYVERYQDLSDDTKKIMQEMIADGHEIAHHTSTHPHSDEYVNKYGVDAYLKYEVDTMTYLMNKDGFYPTTYAYPFGDLTPELDNFLLKRFNSIRKIISPYMNKHIADMDQLYYRYGNISLFYGTSIDQRHKHSMDEITEALEMAKESRQTVSLYCHYLTVDKPYEATNSHIYLKDFKALVLKAKSLGLRFYTASEVSRKKY